MLAILGLVLSAAAPAGAAQGDGASSDALARDGLSTSTSDFAPGDPATFTFYGGGWGHGAGMSQYGAYGRAAAGKTYRAILRFYYPNTRLAQTDYRGAVAVGVASGRSAVTMTPHGRAELKINNQVKAVVRSGQTAVVSHSAAGWSMVVDGVEKCPSVCGGGTAALTYADGTVVDVAGVGQYDHGKIRLVPGASRPDQLFVVVAGLTMDEYLYGLAEMPSSWPAEALKAQAVAGRSFAQHNIEARRASSSWAYPYDLSATTGDQVYAGRAKSAGAYGEHWVGAVEATSGEILVHDGEPIQAFYSSSHGGHSANSEYVFYEALPYIRAKVDPFGSHQNPFHEWTRTYSVAELSRWLGAYSSSNVGTLESIEITGHLGESGRVNRATVILSGTGGTKQITGNELRWRINKGAGSSLDRQLLSTKFSVNDLQPADEAPIGRFKLRDVDDTGNDAGATVWGWALDPDTDASIRVYLKDNNRWVRGQVANDRRTALHGKYGLGNNHGYEFDVDLDPGRHRLCMYARNHPDDTPVLLGCRVVRVGTSPTGVVDLVLSEAADTTPFEPALLTVGGTATDPDRPVELDVVVDIGGTRVVTRTVGGRFTTAQPSPPGPARVCVTARDDSGLKPDTALGCVSHDVVDRAPVGKFKLTIPSSGEVAARGWAIDPDTTAAVRTRLVVDGNVVASQLADGDRPAIATTYGMGPAHGFDMTARVGSGSRQICVEAFDATDAAAPATVLACRTKTVT